MLRLDSPAVPRGQLLGSRGPEPAAAALPTEAQRYFGALSRQVEGWEMMSDNMVNECIRDMCVCPFTDWHGWTATAHMAHQQCW